MSEGLKKSSATPSGRSSIIRGAKYARGFIIRPEQILALIHDTQPGLPLPKDAVFRGLGLEHAGINSQISCYLAAVLAPREHCLALGRLLLFAILVAPACALRSAE